MVWDLEFLYSLPLISGKFFYAFFSISILIFFLWMLLFFYKQRIHTFIKTLYEFLWMNFEELSHFDAVKTLYGKHLVPLPLIVAGVPSLRVL